MKLIRKYPKNHYKRIIVSSLMCCIFLNGLFSVALAGPEGAQVVNGQVSFQQSGYNTTITASDKAIINYSSFDIARPDVVQFIQPNSSASVLNRIQSENPTNINGTLLANGRIFFVNPAGVYIGEGAKINVNQLVASGLNITNSDFINGRFNFEGGNGSVINNGDITAEKVYLIGKQVANSGNISCPAGYVVMAAGDRVFLSEPDSEILVEINPQTSSDPANLIDSELGIPNEEEVGTSGSRIVLGAGDIHTQAISSVGSLAASIEIDGTGKISNSGTIEARSETEAGGTVIAKAAEVINSGMVDVSGSKGGKVEMEATDRLGQFGTIHADGKNSNSGSVGLKAGNVVALSSGSVATANAETNGDGGQVIVYSPDTALFHEDAQIEAKGGRESGDGGFVLVSGKEHVEVFGSTDVCANNGDGGNFFIDPHNVNIKDYVGTLDSEGNPFVASSDGDTISDDAIEGVINNGGSAIVQTSDGGLEEGDIIQDVDATIDFTGAGGDASLTLNAADDVELNGGITVTGATARLNVTINANGAFDTASRDGNVDVNADIATNGGNFTSSGIDFDNTGGMISTNGGKVDIQNTGDVTIGSEINAGEGDIDIDGGDSVAKNIISSGANIISSGTTTLEASGNIGENRAAIETVSTGIINASSTVSGDIYIDNTGAVTLGTVSTASSDIVINNSGDISVNSITAGGSGDVMLSVQSLADRAGADLIINGPVTSGGGITLSIDFGNIKTQALTAAKDISIRLFPSEIFWAIGILPLSGDLILNEPVTSLEGEITLENNFGNIKTKALNAAGDISVQSSLYDWPTIDVSPASGDIILNGPVTSLEGEVELRSNEKIVFDDSDPELITIKTAGPVSLTTGEIHGNNKNSALGIQGATALILRDTGPGPIKLAEVGGPTIGSTSISVDDVRYGTIDITYDNERGRVDIIDFLDSEDLAFKHRVNSVAQPFSFSYTANKGDIIVDSISTSTGDILGGGIVQGIPEPDNEAKELTATRDIFVKSTSGDLILSGSVTSGGGITLESNQGRIVFNDSGNGITPIIKADGPVSLSAGEIYSQGNNGSAHIGIQGATALILRDNGPGPIKLAEVGGSTIGSTSISVDDVRYGTIDITYDNERGRVDIIDFRDLEDFAFKHRVNSVVQPFSFSYMANKGDIIVDSISTSSGDIFIESASGALVLNGPVTSGEGITLKSTFGNIEAQALKATSDIFVESISGDLILSGAVSSVYGGVNLVSTGGIYTKSGLNDTLNVPITGYSDGIKGVDLSNVYPGKAAIVIKSDGDLKLGTDAELTANGIYKTGTDDRQAVRFSITDDASNIPIDVAIFVNSIKGDVTVDSAVSIYPGSTMVIDTSNKINDFGDNFKNSWTNGKDRLELVTRQILLILPGGETEEPSTLLPHYEEASQKKAPSWFWGSKYVLRLFKAEIVFKEPDLTPIINITQVSLAAGNNFPPPIPLISGPEAFKGPSIDQDLGGLISWLEQEGIAPYFEGAYQATLNTDLRFYKAARLLREYAAILNETSDAQIEELTEMLDGIVQPGPIALPIAWFDRQLRVDRQRDEVLYADVGGKWIDALIGFTNILNTQFGWPIDNCINKVMRDYIVRLKADDHKYFVQKYILSVLSFEDRPIFLASLREFD